MSIEWPQPGDQAFREGSACCMPGEIRLIAAGYKDASDVLIDYLQLNGRNDALVFPITFGYRQYLELAIKSLIRIVHAFEETGDNYKAIHELDLLWAKIRCRVDQELESDERVAFEVVESVVFEFHRIDPRSTTFRYSDSCEQFYIDLANMKQTMNRVANFLDSLFDQWESAAQIKGVQE